MAIDEDGDFVVIERLLVMVDPKFLTQAGAQTPKVGRQPIIWSNFPRKLNENERNWTQRGMARVTGAPRSANDL